VQEFDLHNPLNFGGKNVEKPLLIFSLDEVVLVAAPAEVEELVDALVNLLRERGIHIEPFHRPQEKI